MKTLLLILMVLASVAHAQTTLSDAEMTKLIVGTWALEWCTRSTLEFHADGTDDQGEKWAIQDGMYIEIPADPEDRKAYFKILLLTDSAHRN